MFPTFMALHQRITKKNKMDCRRDKRQKRGKNIRWHAFRKQWWRVKNVTINQITNIQIKSVSGIKSLAAEYDKREREWTVSISFCIGRGKVDSRAKKNQSAPSRMNNRTWIDKKKANIESLKWKSTENSLSVHDFFILLNWFCWQPNSNQRSNEINKNHFIQCKQFGIICQT